MNIVKKQTMEVVDRYKNNDILLTWVNEISVNHIFVKEYADKLLKDLIHEQEILSYIDVIVFELLNVDGFEKIARKHIDILATVTSLSCTSPDLELHSSLGATADFDTLTRLYGRFTYVLYTLALLKTK